MQATYAFDEKIRKAIQGAAGSVVRNLILLEKNLSEQKFNV